jgi:hypothetical protein
MPSEPFDRKSKMEPSGNTAMKVFRWKLLGMANALLLFLIPAAFGQLPLPDQVLDTVAFIVVSDGTKVDGGTGFYVKHDGQDGRGYLVTAKHVLMSDSTNYYPNVCMKMNNNKGVPTLFLLTFRDPMPRASSYIPTIRMSI